MMLQNRTIPLHLSKLGIVRDGSKSRQRGKKRLQLTRDNDQENITLRVSTTAAKRICLI